MSKIVFTGASNTAGIGWDLTDSSDHGVFWVHKICNNISAFASLELMNLGIPGASNDMIFQQTVEALACHGSDIEFLFCSWVSVLRYQYSLGFELYDTSDTHVDRTQDLGVNGMIIKKEYVNNIKNRFFALHHLHYEVLKIIRQATILTKLCKQLQVKVFFINDSCPWDKHYFQKKSGLPSTYTPFTQKHILNVDNRADSEIFLLYDKMHQQYQDAGLDQSQWINIDLSFLKLQSDFNHDGQHPGIASNHTYYNLVKTFLNQHSIL